ncbi:MAG: hypothetical protein H6815_09080 [Phycisphaeraceae bacterium]|nr:hypothetical protein [Phycisphaeraceae bacterium]
MLLMLSTTASAQQAAFYPMGRQYPVSEPVSFDYPLHVTNNGTVLGLLATTNPARDLGYTWTLNGGHELLQGFGANDIAIVAYDADATGNYLVGQVVNTMNNPVIWIDRKPHNLIELMPNHHAIATNITPDGTTIIGTYMILQSGNEMFMLNDLKQFAFLGGIPGGTGSITGGGPASLGGISNDGLIGFGAAQTALGQEGAIWRRGNTWETLADLSGVPPYFASFSDSSADGRVACGRSLDASNAMHNIRWTRFHGWQDLGQGAGIQAMSDDGFILGDKQDAYGAAIWNPRDGWVSLREILEVQHGVFVNWLNLGSVLAISDNGEYIAGLGSNESNELEAFLAKLPAFCYADCNADKELDIWDYLCFIDEYNKQSIYANCDNDGRMNIFDFICFGNKFAEGCP